MTRRIRPIALWMALALTALPLAAAAPADTLASQDNARVAEAVRKQIVTLPFYNVFDHVALQFDGETLTLEGEVYRPSMKKSIERVAARVEGVTNIVNNVEVLPTSFHDDRIRVAVLRAVYGNSALNRYGIQSVPPIHIIVRNGEVTLEGVVNREMEKNIAGIAANGVSGVFAVRNNLRVERS